MRRRAPRRGRFVGKLDARNAQEHLQGIREVFEGSNIQVIDVRTAPLDTLLLKLLSNLTYRVNQHNVSIQRWLSDFGAAQIARAALRCALVVTYCQ